MSEHLNNAKISLIEYLLFHYEFKSRISVWLLNYIKATPHKLEHIHFVDHILSEHPTLEMTTQGAKQVGIQLNLSQATWKDSDEIFKYIVEHDEDFDVKIHFKDNATRPSRYDEVLIEQLFYSPSYHAYIQDIFGLSLTQQHETFIINYLKDNIDLSLQLNDKDLFYQLSSLLNQFKLRNMDTSKHWG